MLSFSLKDAIANAVLESLYAKAVARAEKAEERVAELLAYNTDLLNRNLTMKRQIEAEREFWRSMERDPAREFGTLQGKPEPRPFGKRSII